MNRPPAPEQPTIFRELAVIALLWCASWFALPLSWFLTWFTVARLHPTWQNDAISLRAMLLSGAALLIPGASLGALGLCVRFLGLRAEHHLHEARHDS